MYSSSAHSHGRLKHLRNFTPIVTLDYGCRLQDMFSTSYLKSFIKTTSQHMESLIELGQNFRTILRLKYGCKFFLISPFMKWG